eukprot:750630-Hanusia_phi.AAC.1
MCLTVLKVPDDFYEALNDCDQVGSEVGREGRGEEGELEGGDEDERARDFEDGEDEKGVRLRTSMRRGCTEEEGEESESAVTGRQLLGPERKAGQGHQY